MTSAADWLQTADVQCTSSPLGDFATVDASSGATESALKDAVALKLVSEIRPHPSITRRGLAPAVAKLSALADRGDAAFRDPLMITHEGIILDGFARWSLAQQKGRTALPCIVRRLSEEEALILLLQKQRQSAGLNDFTRVSLALELEASFKVTAKMNQKLGGGKKLSSDLTEGQRIDVRAQIAAAAGVCVANVRKVKLLLGSADSAVLTALQSGDIRIHRAWTWLEASRDGGLQNYKNFRNQSGMRRTIQTLISQQIARRSSSSRELKQLGLAITELSKKSEFMDLVMLIEAAMHEFDLHRERRAVDDAAA